MDKGHQLNITFLVVSMTGHHTAHHPSAYNRSAVRDTWMRQATDNGVLARFILTEEERNAAVEEVGIAFTAVLLPDLRTLCMQICALAVACVRPASVSDELTMTSAARIVCPGRAASITACRCHLTVSRAS